MRTGPGCALGKRLARVTGAEALVEALRVGWVATVNVVLARHMQDGLHLLIFRPLHVFRPLLDRLEAAEQLNLMHCMRVSVLVALCARLERDRSCSVGARERS